MARLIGQELILVECTGVEGEVVDLGSGIAMLRAFTVVGLGGREGLE